MQATGVLPTTDPSQLDMYIIIAKRVIKHLLDNAHNIEFHELNQKFNKSEEDQQKSVLQQMRRIVKRPTMVIIYSATTSTMQNYVHNALKEEGVHIS